MGHISPVQYSVKSPKWDNYTKTNKQTKGKLKKHLNCQRKNKIVQFTDAVVLLENAILLKLKSKSSKIARYRMNIQISI